MNDNRENMFIVNFRSCTRFEKEASVQLGVDFLLTHGKIYYDIV